MVQPTLHDFLQHHKKIGMANERRYRDKPIAHSTWAAFSNDTFVATAFTMLHEDDYINLVRCLADQWEDNAQAQVDDREASRGA